MTDRNSEFDSSEPFQPSDWEELARYLSGEMSPDESSRFEATLADRPADRQMLDALKRAISAVPSGIPRDLDIETALARVKGRPDFASPDVIPFDREGRKGGEVTAWPRWRFSMPALAAAALLAVGVASWMAYHNRPRQEAVSVAPRMLATGVGVRDSLTLADGTRLVLGPLSSVKVVAGYGAKSREVELRGDAWFDVVHDAARPFTVRAGSASIVDVGTKFSVRSDMPEGVTVSVVEGAVSLQQVNTPAQQGVILKAGDYGVLHTGGEVTAQRGAVTDDDTAWLQGRLVFREAPMSEVVKSMQKWYGITVEIADPALARRHLTATFDGESSDRVLDVIRLALGAKVDRHGDTAVIRSARGSMRSR